MGYITRQNIEGKTKRYPIADGLEIGRHPNTDVQLFDPAVSKTHAHVDVTDEGKYRLRDCNSSNGTFVNGTQIRDRKVLEDGDQIRIGRTHLIFHESSDDELPDKHQDKESVHVGDRGTHSDIQSRLSSPQEGEFPPADDFKGFNELARDYEKLRVAHELSLSIGPELKLQSLLEKILDQAFRIFEADRGVVLTTDHEAESLHPVAIQTESGKSKTMEHADIRISESILDEVVKNNQAVLSRDAMADDRFQSSDSVFMEQIRSAICVPMLRDGELLGAIYLDSKLASGAFDDKDLDILNGFARQAAVLISHHWARKKQEEETVAREKLSRLLSPQLVDEVVSGRLDIERGGELRNATVMFADVRNFTSVSEKLPPDELLKNLNDYFELMVDTIFAHDGTLDKFIGDEIMAIWGAPISKEDDVERAVLCAIELQELLAAYNAERKKKDKITFEVGIGLNTGEVIAGYTGSSRSMNYTVMGDTVNTASRICSIAPGGSVLVGGETYRQTADIVRAELLPSKSLRGKLKQVDIYRLLARNNAT